MDANASEPAAPPPSPATPEGASLPPAAPGAPPSERDASARLRVVGAAQLVLAGLSACLAPVALLPLLAPAGAPPEGVAPDRRAIVFSVGFYGGLAVFWLWTGLGAIRRRRWVRPVMLSVSFLWLVTGLLGTAVLGAVLPGVLRAQQSVAPGISATVSTLITVIGLGVSALLYVVLPAAVLWAYAPAHVRSTLERVDPKPRWTDGRPIPVVGLTLVLLFAGLAGLASISYGVVPFFNVVLTGPAAMIVLGAMSIAHVVLAWGVHTWRSYGYFGTVLLWLVLFASYGTFLAIGDMDAYLEAARLPEVSRRFVRESGVLEPGPLRTLGLAWAGIAAALLAWVGVGFFRARARRSER